MSQIHERTISDRCALLDSGPPGSTLLLASLLSLLVAKVLWGYWERDLTFGDTSALFSDAVRWHRDGQVNIVWSPLYTAYFGSWLNVTEGAVAATLLHRVGLILISTGLVAWLGLLTLPRILAMLLVVWWIALPIHYDTLYEVHLFGALPILLMALVSLLAGERWRGPLLLSIALVGTFVIRNEYVLAVGVFAVLAGFNFFRNVRAVSLHEIGVSARRYGAVLLASGVLIAYFYSVSYIKGPAIREALDPKHTLNMCQVYAFGYQQRHSDWAGSPWTECSSLMQAKFGSSLPTLQEMIAVNPGGVAEHFRWNLSLTRAGLEVLLFDATSAHDNPDYAPVSVEPVLPSLLLGLTLMICAGGAVLVFRRSPERYADIRGRLARMGPVLLAAMVMAIAVILTQRPRPSYLLGAGALYMWVVSIFLSAVMARFKKLDGLWAAAMVAAALILLVPTYRSRNLPSKSGSLSLIYNHLRPQAPRLCKGSGAMAIGEYASEINNYLCSPYPFSQRGGRNNLVALGSLPAGALSAPVELANALDAAGVGALVIDPYLIQKNQGLKGCPELRSVLLSRGWEQLTYSALDNGRCIASFAK